MMDSSDPIQKSESWESEAKAQGQLRNYSWYGLQKKWGSVIFPIYFQWYVAGIVVNNLYIVSHLNLMIALWIEYSSITGFPGASSGVSVVKNLCAKEKYMVSITGLGRSPGEGNDNPLQYSCLGNPMDRGVWWATVHGIAEELDIT